MGFDVHLNISDNTPEGRAVAAIVERDQVSPEEAVRQILRNAGDRRSPAERMIGLFSNDEDSATIDQVMERIAHGRVEPSTRDIGF